MNHYFTTLVFTILGFVSQAQPDTDVYLFDMSFEKDSLMLSNLKNISDQSGYDNQPSFLDDSHVLFTATRNGQTDICSYNLDDATKIWLTNTESSEYSPLKIPFQNAISAVRLEKDGTQYLVRYPISKDEPPTVLIDDIVIGYHLWLNRHILISSIIKDENLSLTVSDFRFTKHKDLIDNVGRSLSKIPSEKDENNFSFIDKNTKSWQVMSFDLEKLKAKVLFEMLPEVEDLVWLNEDLVLAGKGATLYLHNLRKRSDWQPVASLEHLGLSNITRLAISPNGKKLAIVAEKIQDIDKKTPELIVLQQLEAYNNRDIEAFLNCYSDDVRLYNFPKELISEGKEALREQFGNMFESITDLHAEIENRTIIGNTVIDKEKVRANGKTHEAVAIYEIENGLITRVTFLE
ncbi:steroid delta-isomerase [Subsaximicrobium wynnwilliamsii]|uniref:Steroid delta-isomerase n=1 Tax=Subsaximicrobium wynnwilliamsii TaxID=291179 RepID=A0A5C6ZM70_9FLAO|nr:nuclear transport factor 2 family protein [Subsaximicrobium wynnwilliamsii]TXD84816.1 steroid delta-isomerase [Subsaximicrobium wynnwilliamsii]TXD90487.1 steroid delta-isomerase [Subsaximicrobium wynnwilliamsii]TXE04962.1 steroid delta-isomerase [Subsaximicrobium wynnwilliamsii]